MSPSRSQRSKTAIAVASLVVVMAVVMLALPALLTQVVVPEKTQISRLLGATIPDGLDFQSPEPRGFVQDQADLRVVSSLLLSKEAVRTSLGRPANLPGDSPRYEFDYGYKGPTVRILHDGRVEVVLAMSELRHQSFAGDLWTKLADREQDAGAYVSYVTQPDPKVLAAIGSAHSGLSSQ